MSPIAPGLPKFSVTFKRLSPLLFSLIGVKEFPALLEGESVSNFVYKSAIAALLVSTALNIRFTSSCQFGGAASSSTD